MKKKCLLLAVICLLLTAMPIARADVIFEPPDDFYERHRDECEYVNRFFYANGDGGSAAVYSSPESARADLYIENGTEMHVSFTYDKSGEVYGLVQYTQPDKGVLSSKHYGWSRLGDLLLKFDSLEFLSEYEAKILPFSGTFDGAGASKMVLWSWPGSGEVISVENMADFTGGGSWSIEDVYTDSEGREWGHIGYYYGRRNIWVCMSDPENENIPATITQTVAFKTPSPDGISAQAQNAGASFPVLPVLLVVGVVIVTAFLILRLSKKQGR